MLRRLPAALAAALALAACRPAPAAAPTTPADVDARLLRLEERLDRLAASLTTTAGAAALPPDVRLARLEGQLEKVVAFLRQAVPATLDAERMYAVPIDPRDPALGPVDAAVTIVEAYEFLCPYCALVEPTLDQLRARYPKELRVVSKYYVIHGEPAVPGGQAACAAARQGKYGPFKAALWKAIWPDGGRPDHDQATTAAIERVATAAGLELKRFQADVAGPCATWPTESGETLQRFGAGGTPSFWINGRPFQGNDVDAFAAAIDAELARVKASGKAPATYYQRVVLATGEPAAIMVSPLD